jgi:NCAIR mutase (PurE)-related protein
MTRPKKQSGKITDLGYARIDLERQDRCGAAEVIFGEGKSPAQVAQIAEALDKAGQRVLVTRTNADAYRAVKKKFPKAKWYPEGRIITTEPLPRPRAADAPLAICAAGTADLPVAEEAVLCARFWGYPVATYYDIGVAGLHRLLTQIDEIRKAKVIIVIAGMEGALPSVVGGLVHQPVIAVPTSAGYGVGEGGKAALMGMLSSCASGVTVMNIDNGFGAAYAAHRILLTV